MSYSEELNIKVDEESLRYLGTLENIFTFNGDVGHEIVFVYDGALKESAVHKQAVILGKEANGEDIRAMWMSLDEFDHSRSTLYPAGLLKLLR